MLSSKIESSFSKSHITLFFDCTNKREGQTGRDSRSSAWGKKKSTLRLKEVAPPSEQIKWLRHRENEWGHQWHGEIIIRT